MKLFDGSFILMGIVLAILAVGGLVSIKFLGQDNPVEEAVEEIIKNQTGLDIDLSPETKETKDSKPIAVGE